MPEAARLGPRDTELARAAGQVRRHPSTLLRAKQENPRQQGVGGKQRTGEKWGRQQVQRGDANLDQAERDGTRRRKEASATLGGTGPPTPTPEPLTFRILQGSA